MADGFTHQSWLSADQPIEHTDQDRLNRKDFARELAASVSGWSGKQSLTIALNGAWGSGNWQDAIEWLLQILSGEKEKLVCEFTPTSLQRMRVPLLTTTLRSLRLPSASHEFERRRQLGSSSWPLPVSR